MTKWIAVSAVAAVVLAVSVARLDAGPEKIAFPANWKEHVLYATLDRYDTKQYRELYGTPDAVRAANRRQRREHRRVRLRARQARDRRWAVRDVDQCGRLPAPDHPREDGRALAGAAEGPEPRAGLHRAWDLRVQLRTPPGHEGRD